MKAMKDLLRPDASPPEIELRVRQAYTALFEARGSREDADIVLLDLAKASGFFQTLPATVPNEVLKHAEGNREVFGRILFAISAPLDTLMEISTAILRDTEENGE